MILVFDVAIYKLQMVNWNLKVNILRFIKLFLCALISWPPVLEAKVITKKDIVGLWRVVDFIIISGAGEEKKWAINTHGTLIYTESNFMSVSINGEKNNEPVSLFYSGKYSVCPDNVIKHKVLNATDPNRINKTMIRSATYKKGILTLTANGTYGTALIKWKKYNLGSV